MYIYKAIQKPVLILGVPFKAFYALAFMSFGIFMGTLNVFILVISLGVYFVVRAMTARDYDFFAILRRSWGYEERIK